MNSAEEIYDRLFEFESSKKTGHFPVHKKLAFDNSDWSLVDWILANIQMEPNERLLDAGCGNGHTLLRLAMERGINGLGISISSLEISSANKQAQLEDLANQVSFEVRSFDEPIQGLFHKIIAIESLKHSNDLNKTLTNLATCTDKTGFLIIADDFVVRPTKKSHKHQQLWDAPSFTTIEAFKTLLEKCGYKLVELTNISSLVSTKSKITLKILMPIISFVSQIVGSNSRRNLQTMLGGLMLEYLYATKSAAYYILIATKRTE